MKVGRYVTLDTDLCAKLEGEPNVSGLINNLLRQHFETEGKNLRKKIRDFAKNSRKTLKEMKKQAEIYEKNEQRYANMKKGYHSDAYRKVQWEV